MLQMCDVVLRNIADMQCCCVSCCFVHYWKCVMVLCVMLLCVTLYRCEGVCLIRCVIYIYIFFRRVVFAFVRSLHRF